MRQIDYDAIVLGSGHNSLVLAAYLAKAGLGVLCLEAGETLGGGLTTEEFPAESGFLHNTHSFYHRGVAEMPWYRDLELERHGARYLQPPHNVALLTRDGRALSWYDDFEQTAGSFAAFSRRDAESLRQWREAFLPIVRGVLEPEARRPPLPPDERERRLRQTAEGRLLLETSRLSPREFVQREFEHPAVQAALLFFNGLREVDLRESGFGHHIPALLASGRMAQMCVGGSARLAEALVAAVREAGGEVRPSTRPARIAVENGRVAGVETKDGELLRAGIVVSGLNPQQTFLELIDEHLLPADWRAKAAAFRYNLLAPLFGIYLNLLEPPDYHAARRQPDVADAFMVILGIEDAGQFDEIVRHHEAGTIPPTTMWGSCPTRFDPTQAPPNRHTAFLWEKLPYRIGGDATNWEKLKHDHARKMLDTWRQYMTNVDDAAVEIAHIGTPADTARRLPNMCDGDLLVGAFSGGQVGYHRPFPGAGHYRGHLQGLYLCGACCHPGGNITGLPGYNGAQVVLADLGIGWQDD